MKTVLMSVLLTALANSSCSTRQGYVTVQEYQRNVCNQISDFPERQRCLERINASYESYQRQTEDIKAPK
jgi:hypothetical protein